MPSISLRNSSKALWTILSRQIHIKTQNSSPIINLFFLLNNVDSSKKNRLIINFELPEYPLYSNNVISILSFT